MLDYQHEFLDFAIATQALRFGEFTLKSGRVSPYFFNTGLFNSGKSISRLGQYYASAIMHSGMEFDMLFGPAYKGVPLAVATAIALHEKHSRDVPYAFNRKEAKHYGEGGVTVGAPLAGRILIIDDVISAGTSVRESVDIIRAQSAQPAGVVIALDRQERGAGTLSAVEEVKKEHNMAVANIVSLADLIDYLAQQPGRQDVIRHMREYQAQYAPT